MDDPGELSGAPGVAAELAEDVPGLEPTPLSVAPAAGNKHQAALRASPPVCPARVKPVRTGASRVPVVIAGQNPVTAGITTRKDSKSAAWQGITPGVRLAGPRGDATPGHPAPDKPTGTAKPGPTKSSTARRTGPWSTTSTSSHASPLPATISWQRDHNLDRRSSGQRREPSLFAHRR